MKAPGANDAVLEVRGLTVQTAQGLTLVDGLDLHVAGGERFAVIGESGSGKSVTGLAVMGLLPQGLTVRGSIRVCGEEVVGAPERRLRRLRGSRVGIVFQEPLTALDPLTRLGAQLGEALARAASAEGRRLRGAGRRRAVREALEAVQIDDADRLARAYPHEASGGQRQRVAIAMALACKPDVLILDEPTTALDVTVQAEVLGLLRRLVADNGMATLFVSHDLAVVAAMAERALVLRAGRAVETGEVTTLLTAPRKAYTRELVAAARALDDSLGDAGRAPGPEGWS
ncbi:MAG TPA: ABC transporter ATP-binding protein [Microbacteriaceae bacterium]|nr:ABC transporter ATP-binding protein [Microbacteriaceae bacterium]